jgi:hypothetical protein
MAGELADAGVELKGIVALLHEANKPAETLAIKFGQAAQGGKGMEIVMRYLSGTGAWRFLNKVKATGQLITGIYDNITETNKAQYESIQIISEEVATLNGLAQLRTEELNTNNEIYEGLRLIHGEEEARNQTKKRLNEAYGEQFKKVQKIREMQMSDKDVIGKIKAEKKAIANLDSKQIGPAKKALKEAREQLEITGKGAMLARRKVKLGEKLGGLDKRALERDKEAYNIYKQQNEKLDELAATRESIGKELAAAKTIGAKRGITTEGGRERNPITAIFMKRFKKITRAITAIASFVKKIGKLMWALMKMAFSFLMQAIMWGAVIIISILLLKPIFLKLWKKFKSYSKDFGAVKEGFNKFKEVWDTQLMPLFMQAWESMKTFWNVLSDPNATIKEGLMAAKNMAFDVGYALWATAKAWAVEVLIPLGLTLFAIAKAGLLELKDWVFNTLFPYLYEQIPIWLDWLEVKLIALKDWLATQVPIWVGAIWDWVLNTGLPKLGDWLAAFGEWFVMDFGKWVFESLYPWITGTLWPWLIEKLMALGEWFVMDFGGWVATELPGILSDALGELKDVLFNTNWAGSNWIPFDGKAAGGLITKTAPYLVGEKGPELVQLNAGNNVVPNHSLNSRNTINVHVNGRVGASDQELRDIARKVGSMISREINRTTASGVRL